MEVQVSPQPSFNKQFNRIIEDLNSHHDLGLSKLISVVQTPQQAQRFYDIFETVDEDVHCQTHCDCPYIQGFIDHDKKIVCYTDHQIFERYHKFHLKNGFSKKQSITLKNSQNSKSEIISHI